MTSTPNHPERPKRIPDPPMPEDPKVLARAMFRQADRELEKKLGMSKEEVKKKRKGIEHEH
ncbi:MAG: hypothetical protein OXC83_05120 [Chloroflexi bacterium]|nr:hypothetical protein [Chloroflexota bacterium]